MNYRGYTIDQSLPLISAQNAIDNKILNEEGFVPCWICLADSKEFVTEDDKPLCADCYTHSLENEVKALRESHYLIEQSFNNTIRAMQSEIKRGYANGALPRTHH